MHKLPRFLILAFVFGVAFFLYIPVTQFDFVNFDDPAYVSQNPHVQQGLTGSGIAWALTSGENANWFPVTRISHLLDASLFGMRAGGHHLSSAFLHAVACVLLFLFLETATRARAPSVFVALMFAVHPLHVESVAWVSERKDVLCAMFWFAGLWAYALRRNGWALGLFALGLTAKPMIVTFPFLLLLLDFWPLKRDLNRSLWREKIPFFALAAISAIGTFWVQASSGAVRDADQFSWLLRVENALVSVFVYLGQMFWPAGLAVFYPYPATIPIWQAAPAAVALGLISWLAVRMAATRPWIAVGWFWFLITLAPVIGIVQVGAQAHADRYMYVPMVGPLVALAWSFGTSRVAALVGGVAVVACAVATWIELPEWKDSETLFTHAAAVTERNYLAEHNLGSALLDEPGRLPDAIRHLQTSLQFKANSVSAMTDLGTALAKSPGRLSEAVDEYRAALRLDPDSGVTHADLGAALAQSGRPAEAASEYKVALTLIPGLASAQQGLQSLSQFEANSRGERGPTNPNSAAAHYYRALDLAKTGGDPAEAVLQFEAALRIRPDYPEAHNNLGVVLARDPRTEGQAVLQFEAALKGRPDYAEAHFNLGAALANMPGKMAEAIAQFEAAEKLQPDPETRGIIEKLKAMGR